MALINPRTGYAYYCGEISDITMICRVLNLEGGRIQKITDPIILKYMDMVEQSVDSYLESYYFTPIREYNVVNASGQIVKQFPGRLRRLSQYWCAGLMITSEFQQLDANTSQIAETYIKDAQNELYQLTIFNQRLPGQVYKSSWGNTFPPSLQPGMQPERSY